MTTLYQEEVRCAVCDEVNTFTDIGSTNAFGSHDLDTRPPEMQRSTIYTWVQRCPACGYCARRLDEAPSKAKTVVESNEYRQQLASADYPDLANAFLCLGLVAENARAIQEAAWASIHAAWACDDAANPEAAARCRLQAVGFIRRLHEQNLTLAEQPGADQAMLTDLLRRAGCWEEALDVVDQSIAGIDNELIRSVLRYEKALIVRGDLEVHRIEEAESGG